MDECKSRPLDDGRSRVFVGGGLANEPAHVSWDHQEEMSYKGSSDQPGHHQQIHCTVQGRHARWLHAMRVEDLVW